MFIYRYFVSFLCYWTLKGSQDMDILCHRILNRSQNMNICVLVDTDRLQDKLLDEWANLIVNYIDRSVFGSDWFH